MCNQCKEQGFELNPEFETILHSEDEYNYRSAELNNEYNYRTAEINDINNRKYENSQYEIVGSSDTRVLITDTTVAPFRYICQISTQTSDGKWWVGSGFFIGPKTILTAGHVIWDESANRKVPNNKIFISPARNGSNKPFGTVNPANVIISYSGFTSSDFSGPKDYAIVHLGTDLGNKTGYFSSGTWVHDTYGSSILSNGTLPNSPSKLYLNVAGYPGDKGGEKQYSSYNLGFALQDGGKILSYLTDTKGGQSGGPVWVKMVQSAGGRVIVGIHIARGPWVSNPPNTVQYNKAVFITAEVKRFINANWK